MIIKIIILRQYLEKSHILRKFLEKILILRIRMLVNTSPGLVSETVRCKMLTLGSDIV